jgi:hypothetical protein
MACGKIRTTLCGIVASSLLIGSAVLATPAAFADDDDDEDDDRYGAYVYAGTIDMIDDATEVDEIGELERDDNREELWTPLGAGQDMPDELYTEDEDLEDDLSPEDLTAEPHLIVVYESDDKDSPIVAVGVIEGDTDENGGILIQLIEHEGSGFEGRAWVGPERDDDDDDDNDVDVVVGIYPAGEVEPLGTPEAVG